MGSNAPVQCFAQSNFACQGLVDHVQEFFLVLRQTALQGQVVGGVVAGEVEGGHVQVLNEQAALLQHMVGGSDLNPPSQHILPQRGALGGRKGHG